MIVYGALFEPFQGCDTPIPIQPKLDVSAPFIVAQTDMAAAERFEHWTFTRMATGVLVRQATNLAAR
jgi:hypothetical protein